MGNMLLAIDCLVLELDDSSKPFFRTNDSKNSFATKLQNLLVWIRILGGNPKRIIIQIDSLNKLKGNMIENLYNSRLSLPLNSKVVLMNVKERYALALNEKIDINITEETWLVGYLSPHHAPFLINNSVPKPSSRRRRR